MWKILKASWHSRILFSASDVKVIYPTTQCFPIWLLTCKGARGFKSHCSVGLVAEFWLMLLLLSKCNNWQSISFLCVLLATGKVSKHSGFLKV